MMAADASSRHESLSLYNFMCQHIVGTEKTVRTKRLINNVKDNLTSTKDTAHITSGSFGEGLELKGSDVDLMYVTKDVIIHEKEDNLYFDTEKINLIMDMTDTRPGFTLLQMLQHDKSEYLSSELFKANILQDINYSKGKTQRKIHGPCVSAEGDSIDFAFCFHNKNWIQPLQTWIDKGHTPWLSSDVKSYIIEGGVLLVPVGSKGSKNEHLEWRISFSVAEKFLIYSFSHSQLLCYALMKILLKDLISSNSNCKDLLCSYFIKTILFWVSEETAVTEWKPENLIPCFMKCFRRLVYAVEYSLCPHYFIPIVNLFENKIEGRSKLLLLEHLKALLSFGWRCMLSSAQFQNFTIHSNELHSKTEINKQQLQLLLKSKITMADSEIFKQFQSYRKCIRQLHVNKSCFIKSIYLRYLSVICGRVMQHSMPSTLYTNKNIYYQYRKKQCYLLQNVNHDAVSGWLMLAAFFYSTEQYSISLYILNHTLHKCTPEIRKQIFKSTTLQNLGILRLFKHLSLNKVVFQTNSDLIPAELALDVSKTVRVIPQSSFAIFLCFLCHYNLNDRQQCHKYIKDLKRTISEKCCIASKLDEGQCYNLLGVSLQLIGQNVLAAKAFLQAIECDPYYNSAAERLKMMEIK